MTTSSQNASPFSRFSRALGLSNKFNTISPRSKPQSFAKAKENNEDWYIPYNGPYEPPKPVARREKERDSWGDPIDGEDDDPEDHVLADPELHNRYGQISSSPDWKGGQSGGARRRSRTHSGGSVFSGRTGSSGTVDPNRVSTGAPRRSTVSGSTQLPPVPPLMALDAVGGVGDSPIPLLRGSSSSTPTRKSLASLFTFNSSNKKWPSTPSAKPPPDPNRQAGMTVVSIAKPDERPAIGASKLPITDIKSGNIPPLPPDLNLATEALCASGATNDEDYYNSYYSTLLNISSNYQHDLSNTGPSDPPDSNTGQPYHIPEEPHSSASDASSALHPYAYTFPSPSYPSDVPQSAPPMQKTHFQSIHPPLDSTRTPIPHMSTSPHNLRHLAFPPHQISLSHSTSTPNLRGKVRPPYSQSRKNFKDRLLSAETWCDALLFPRPRLKIKRDGASGDSTPSYTSGRIVSPPGSPVADYFSNRLAAETGIASRVLANSRSLVDLSTSRAGPSTLRREVPLPPPVLTEVKQNKSETTPLANPPPAPVRPPRPKSWALDDLVLPSPVPSLSRVLEEGQILEHQRKKWQTQAINSFQNERARALSRTRTKSLRGKKRLEKPNPLEYLAARGLLGDQDPIHVHLPSHRLAHTARPRTASETDSRGTWTISHGHSTSLSKTVSKSSKTHSRNNSIGKSAIKIAKSTAKSTVALCRADGGGVIVTPVEEQNKNQAIVGERDAFEGAMRATGTRVIRLIDPAQTQLPFSPISPLDTYRLSPTPSGGSNPRIGIAISTPPLTDEAIDRESIRLPTHPYAQGGLTVSVASPANQANKGINLESTRSPTHGSPPTHPYALVSAAPSTDSYSYSGEGRIVPEVRPDSLVPPADKMWAQWGSGVVREILPSDLQYSPFVTTQSFTAGDEAEKAAFNRSMRNSSPIYDTAGIGEALAWAARRQSRDSGLGASEEQGSSNFVRNSQVIPEHDAVGVAAVVIGEKPTEQVYASARRIPVQYDASRPAHLHHARKNSAPAPSPLGRVQQDLGSTPNSRPAPLARNYSVTSSPGESSTSSSPPMTSPVLGNPDDLDNYRDLFYRPRGMSVDGETPPLNVLNTRSPPHPLSNIPWDVRSQGTNRTGLTSIVRQLSEELDDAHDEQPRRSISLSSRSSLSVLRQSVYATGRTPPTDSSLRFVFSNIPETASVEAVTRVKPVANEHDAHGSFYPSIQVPEDIETSTRASSPTSPIDDEALGVYRLGNIETSSTPLAESSDPRLSYVGQMSYAHEDIRDDEHEDVLGTSPNFSRLPATAHSSLQPPSADPTRSSYMTSNSEGSRMSGLSDFPAPPPQHLTPAHMSLLSSYFDETLTPSELAQVQAQGVHSRPGTRSRAGSLTAHATLGRHGGHNTPADGQTVAGDHLDREKSLDDNNQIINNLLEKPSPT
ncbi:hypothetical protein L218DRAFT_897317 [Marasmius fiardii PR-910]|nr:hypothetical protein L218DRAFT_897317 [Marasmius fiardii PR-910]